MQRKRIRAIFLGLLAVGVGVVFVGRVLVPALQSRQVERAIARFETSPSQAAANELTELLDRGIPSRQQGERMLKVLLYPKIVTRAVYPAGFPAVVSLERPFEVRFSYACAVEHVELLLDGRRVLGPSGRGGGPGHTFEVGPDFYNFTAGPLAPGFYKGEIRCEYVLTLATKKTSWSWHPLKGRLPRSLLPRKRVTASMSDRIPDYTWRLSVPADFRVASRNKAEKIGLLSGAELDKRMRSAFTAGPRKISCTYPTDAGERHCKGALEIQYAALPAAVAFTPTLRLANGTRISRYFLARYPGRYRARANASGTFSISPWDFRLERTGDYTATVILTPDPNDAYEDPAIKAIWNRTLEFPIRFTIDCTSSLVPS